ncbi:MAG: exodeoxyribonuclease III [Elusimicrobiota bacterium]
MPKTYRLFSWNVNGIRAAARKGLLDWMAREAPDVLCLQETKAMPSQLGAELLDVRGYQVDFCWGEKKGYSGVATYSGRPAGVAERGLGISEHDREGRVLIHHFPEFTLFNVYFPNGKARPERFDYKMRFYRDFLGTLRRYHRRGRKNMVVCGDVNTAHREIDLAHPRENRGTSGFLPQERAWIDELLGSGFSDTFRSFERGPGHYTWWDLQSRARQRNVGWRIDYFFVSESLKPHVKNAAIHPDVMGSDHCPIAVELGF